MKTPAFLSLLLLLLAAPAFAQLPDGEGKDLTTKTCGACHQPDVVKDYHLSKDGWSDMISKMIEQGAEGTDAQFNTILEYLAKNFPPQVNVNKADAAELEKQLAITSTESAAIVAYRAAKGPFKQIEDFQNVPGLDYKKVAAQKDRIAF